MSASVLVKGEKYTFKEDHRDNTLHKSQWKILQPAEVQCFATAAEKGWRSGNNRWGLHIKNDRVNYLGVAAEPDRHRRLFVGKFVGNGNDWHGYPADHIGHQQDKPPKQVLIAWKTSGLINLSKVRKLMKGQPCSL